MDDAKPTPKHHPECDGHFLLVFALGIPKNRQNSFRCYEDTIERRCVADVVVAFDKNHRHHPTLKRRRDAFHRRRRRRRRRHPQPSSSSKPRRQHRRIRYEC